MSTEPTERERIENFILTAAIDGYASMHGISLLETVDLFKRFGVFGLLRDNYATLCTQAPCEGAAFADSYITRMSEETHLTTKRSATDASARTRR